MQSISMLMGKAGGSVRVTKLDCSVQEDWERGRSYSIHWHSLSLISHPQDRHWEARRLLQHCLSGTMQQEAIMHLRPPQICLKGCTQPGPLHPQEEVCFISGLKRAIVGVWVRRDLTPVWSTVVGFTNLPMAPGRVVTQRG